MEDVPLSREETEETIEWHLDRGYRMARHKALVKAVRRGSGAIVTCAVWDFFRKSGSIAFTLVDEFGYIDDYMGHGDGHGPRPTAAPVVKCECGVAKVGGIHSSWCPAK